MPNSQPQKGAEAKSLSLQVYRDDRLLFFVICGAKSLSSVIVGGLRETKQGDFPANR
ncbi:MAG: hypothetical protein LBT04_03085 [Prevotellaceae bacterium]|nr:hypothetical protein [Prevotellaceae bacterium]